MLEYLFAAALLLAGGQGLRDVHVRIPVAVQRGEIAILSCLYDLDGDVLYTVKWYKGRREFYRYTPKETPSVKVFPLSRHEVLDKISNSTVLVFNKVESEVTGYYACEVSADAPSFQTSIAGGNMDVVESPHHNPTVTGIHSKYRLGDTIKGDCFSKNSKPAANLTWQINGLPANHKFVKHHPVETNEDGLQTSRLGIRFLVTKHHFVKGHLKIKCIAALYTVYHKSTEKSVQEVKPRTNSATPNTLSINQKPDPHEVIPTKSSFYDQDHRFKSIHSASTSSKGSQTSLHFWCVFFAIHRLVSQVCDTLSS